MSEDKKLSLVLSAFLRKKKKDHRWVCIIMIIAAVSSFLTALFIPRIEFSIYSYLIFIGLILLSYIYTRLTEYRIKKGNFGDNEYEARELLKFTQSLEAKK